MNTLNFHPESGLIWIQNMIHGLSGLTIKAKHSVFSDSSLFQKVEVFDTYRFGQVLCLGGSIVMTEADGCIYHEMMTHPALFMHKKPERVCIIGGGDGGCLKEVLAHDIVKSVVVVDIDEMVTDTIKRFFPALATGFSDKRTELVFEDGYSYLEKTDQKFDLIVVDSYDPNGPVQSLETDDFHRVVSMRLADDGIAVFQTDSPTVNSNYLRNTIKGVSPCFDYYKPYICSMYSFPEGICSFLICAKQDSILENFEKERFEKLADQFHYYNEEIHTGAFLLPQHIRNLLKP
ncbi:MAG: polyamine aminopropyltransferase [Fibrobacter sp.]|nr:polyamine aminopropyltransferase [Fibrobacter sp.]